MKKCIESPEYFRPQIHEWQMCPKCGGVGTISPIQRYDLTAIYTAYQICDICYGDKIISKVNGKPPQHQ